MLFVSLIRSNFVILGVTVYMVDGTVLILCICFCVCIHCVHNCVHCVCVSGLFGEYCGRECCTGCSRSHYLGQIPYY